METGEISLKYSPCASPAQPSLYNICSPAKPRYGWTKGDKDTSISNYPFQIRSLGLVLHSCALSAVGHEPQCESKKVSVVKLYMAS